MACFCRQRKEFRLCGFSGEGDEPETAWDGQDFRFWSTAPKNRPGISQADWAFFPFRPEVAVCAIRKIGSRSVNLFLQGYRPYRPRAGKQLLLELILVPLFPSRRAGWNPEPAGRKSWSGMRVVRRPAFAVGFVHTGNQLPGLGQVARQERVAQLFEPFAQVFRHLRNLLVHPPRADEDANLQLARQQVPVLDLADRFLPVPDIQRVERIAACGENLLKRWRGRRIGLTFPMRAPTQLPNSSRWFTASRRLGPQQGVMSSPSTSAVLP